MTPLRPRGPEPTEEEAAASRGPEEGGKAELPPDFRESRVGEYRARQKKQYRAKEREAREARKREAKPKGKKRGDEGGGAGDEGPPQPPAPPPANNWIPIGPSVVRQGQGGTLPPVSGRILGFAVASGGNRVYAATSNGGVWRSDDAGVSWRSLMDAWDLDPTNQASDSLSCGAIAIDPGNADRIFVGTGDGDEGLFLGVGPVVSVDGGANWATEPVAAASPQLAGSAFFALAVDPGNTDRVVGATLQGLYRREPDGAGGFRWARKATPSGAISGISSSGSATSMKAWPIALAGNASSATLIAGSAVSSPTSRCQSAAGSGA